MGLLWGVLVMIDSLMNEIKVGDIVAYATKELDSIQIRIGKVIKLNPPYKINLTNVISINGLMALSGYKKYKDDFEKSFKDVIKKVNKETITVSCFRTIVLSKEQIEKYKNYFEKE